MKRFILTLIATVAAFGIIPAVVSAAPVPIPNVTEVYGVVSNNGSPVKGAKVIVICNGHDLKTTTTALVSGSPSYNYLVTFPASECAAGSNVTVTADKGSKGGEKGGKITNVSADLNVSLVNVSLPELGLVTGLGAVTIGSGAFFLVRRRQLGQN